MNVVQNRYLRGYQVKLCNRLLHLNQAQVAATTARDSTAACQQADILTKILHECDERERQTVLPLAQARLELDLDHGVKTNYLKLGEALAPSPGWQRKTKNEHTACHFKRDFASTITQRNCLLGPRHE